MLPFFKQKLHFELKKDFSAWALRTRKGVGSLNCHPREGGDLVSPID